IVKLGPVPAKVDLTVGYTATQTSNINITVYDVAGKVVAVKVVDAVNGYNEVKLNVANYAAGTYYITLNNGTEVITNKFMKQ
ncbi:MAG TPA: T9SS type A sorting domain-containing protein, partial [Chitinophagales bacterium]|nr:T9SS type A sorting domain-containing protein [Chitinophagales bacterium]